MDAKRPTAFVIMPFSIELVEVFENLITPALEGYEVIRADTRLDERGILEKIVTGIDEADLVIADLTQMNPNVMYELGVAHALGKPTVMLTQLLAHLPFDIRAYPVHEYSRHVSQMSIVASHLRELAARHRDGLVQFANPVTDFIERLAEVPRQLPGAYLDKPYSFDMAVNEAVWGLQELAAIFPRYPEISNRYFEMLKQAGTKIGHGIHDAELRETGIREAADNTRTLAQELNELSLQLHEMWERAGPAILWLLAPEQRSRVGAGEAQNFAVRARALDEHLNRFLDHLAELRQATGSFPELSGNLTHAFEVANCAASNLLNEIMTAKSYLRRVIGAASKSV